VTWPWPLDQPAVAADYDVVVDVMHNALAEVGGAVAYEKWRPWGKTRAYSCSNDEMLAAYRIALISRGHDFEEVEPEEWVRRRVRYFIEKYGHRKIHASEATRDGLPVPALAKIAFMKAGIGVDEQEIVRV
jgi:hypothetical protein